MPQKTNAKDILAVGRRKTAVAKICLNLGTGKITINSKEIANPSRVYTEPLKLTGYDKKVDIKAKVAGGGIVANLFGSFRSGNDNRDSPLRKSKLQSDLRHRF